MEEFNDESTHEGIDLQSKVGAKQSDVHSASSTLADVLEPDLPVEKPEIISDTSSSSENVIENTEDSEIDNDNQQVHADMMIMQPPAQFVSTEDHFEGTHVCGVQARESEVAIISDTLSDTMGHNQELLTARFEGNEPYCDVENHDVELVVEITLLQMINELASHQEIFTDIDVFELKTTENELEIPTHTSSSCIGINQAPPDTSYMADLEHQHIENDNVHLAVEMTLQQMLDEVAANEGLGTKADVFSYQLHEEEIDIVSEAPSYNIDFDQEPHARTIEDAFNSSDLVNEHEELLGDITDRNTQSEEIFVEAEVFHLQPYDNELEIDSHASSPNLDLDWKESAIDCAKSCTHSIVMDEDTEL